MSKSLTYESDMEHLEALRKGEPGAFEYLYRQFYRMVAKQALDMGLQNTEVEDTFQEMLMILLRKIRDVDFQLTAKLSTYVYAVARNLLLKKTNKKAEFPVEDAVLHRVEADWSKEELEERTEQEERMNVVIGHLELLEADCRKVLQLSFFEKRPQAEIASEMGYSEAFVKVKKFRCLEYLRKQVKNHPLFKDLQNNAS